MLRSILMTSSSVSNICRFSVAIPIDLPPSSFACLSFNQSERVSFISSPGPSSG
jgi:hypothetical protein